MKNIVQKAVILILTIILVLLVRKYMVDGKQPDNSVYVVPDTVDIVMDEENQTDEEIDVIESLADMQESVDISKELIKDQETKAVNFTKALINEVEIVAVTQKGLYGRTYSAVSENANWFKRTFAASSCNVAFDYTVKYVIPATLFGIDSYLGVVNITYEDVDIYPILSAENVVFENNRKIFGKKYNDKEKSACINDALERLEARFLTDSNLIEVSCQNIDSFLVNVAKEFGIEELSINGEKMFEPEYDFSFDGNIRYNSSYLPLEKVEYIVVHSTAVYDKDAEGFRYTYDNYQLDRKANAHFFVDYDSVVQMLDTNIQSGNCYTENPKIPAYNSNTVSLEICQFHDETLQQKSIDNAADFVKKLKVIYPDAKVVMHREISQTNCPEILTDEEFEELFR